MPLNLFLVPDTGTSAHMQPAVHLGNDVSENDVNIYIKLHPSNVFSSRFQRRTLTICAERVGILSNRSPCLLLQENIVAAQRMF